jgi:glycosyltransferase involved in cell wall biosynthesis
MNKKQEKPTVSIIVTARNYGLFLEECLRSCLRQTHPAMEVIYSDDFSEDNSIAIANSIKGVKVVQHSEWVGVVRARNDGVAASSGQALVHVDGDDMLPPDFIEKHLSVFDETTPFVYCEAQAFGLKDNLWRVPEWKEGNIWYQNYVNTSNMMWRWVFDAAGGWQETCEKTMWDWSLAIRAAKQMKTPPKPSPVALLYRQHEYSYSRQVERRPGEPEKFHLINLNLRKELTTMSICCIYGGRIPELMPLWLNTLIEDISILHNKPELIIINNSNKPIHWVTSYHKKYFSTIKILAGFPALSWGNERERREKVSTLLADCHNLAVKRMTGDLIHFREDDMITNAGAFEKMYEFIMDIRQNKRRAAVGALYLNRHSPQIVGGKYNYQQPQMTRDLKDVPTGKTPVSVDFTGTGCLLYWREMAPTTWYPFVGGNICAHDWRFGVDLKAMGKDIYILPDAICKHIKGLTWDFVEPDSTEDVNVLNYTRKER